MPIILLVLVGCGSKLPAVAAKTALQDAFTEFRISIDPKRTHETTDIGVRGFWYAFDSKDRQSHLRCLQLAQHMIEHSKEQKKIDFIKVLVSTSPDTIPYFRYTWSRPKTVKIGEYEKYVVEDNDYE